MKTQQILKIAAFIFVFSFCKLKAQTVYIADNGKKYHQRNCSSAKTGKHGIELAEAKKQGYEPCKVCMVADDKKDKPKEKSKTPAKK